MRDILVVALAVTGVFTMKPQVARAERIELAVPHLHQQTEVWCWAASASMAMSLLGYPNMNRRGNYQCGFVAVVFPECDSDCRLCSRPIGALPNMVIAIRRYQERVAAELGFRNPDIQPRYVEYPTFEQIRDSIKIGAPVIAGISPGVRPQNPAFTRHAVLVIGVEESRSQDGGTEQWIIVNDPYDYAAGQDPYDRLGGFFHSRTERAFLPWEAFSDGLNLTSAIFLRDPLQRGAQQASGSPNAFRSRGNASSAPIPTTELRSLGEGPTDTAPPKRSAGLVGFRSLRK